MAESDFQQEPARYYNRPQIMMARMGAIATITAAAIAVREIGCCRAKSGESGGGGCEDISELTSAAPGGETADKEVEQVL